VSTTLETQTAVEVSEVVYVDLDGTFLRTDTLWESLLQLMRRQPWLLFLFLLQVLAGKAKVKSWLASHVELDVATLPYRPEVLEFVQRQRDNGHKVVLATGAHRSIATAVARHFGCFDDVLATDEEVNLTGENKLARILDDCDNGPFHYVGDSRHDIPIWRKASSASYIPKHSVMNAARAACPAAMPINANLTDGAANVSGSPGLRIVLRQMRLHQWSKNVLLFLPLVMAHRFSDLNAWFTVAAAFLSFSCCASAGHVINDLLDLDSDRCHPDKRFRPVASGNLAIQSALLLAISLFVAGVVLSLVLLPLWFCLVVVGYTACSLWYSMALKELLLIDVLVLAGFYSYRIWAGGVVVDVEISRWLVAFSGFFFLNLAFLKRYTDLMAMKGGPQIAMGRRDYRVEDIEIIRVFGPVSGLLSVLVLALYLNSDAVVHLYVHPERLWLICPLMIYWIGRTWILSHRGEMPSDPVGFALRDGASYLVGAASVAIFALAS